MTIVRIGNRETSHRMLDAKRYFHGMSFMDYGVNPLHKALMSSPSTAMGVSSRHRFWHSLVVLAQFWHGESLTHLGIPPPA